jgi:putative transposase
MRELAQVRMRYGYRRLHVLLQREGWVLGRELAYRLYTEESLQLRSKRPRRRKMAVARRERYVPKRVNQAWSMDFVADQLADGRKLRGLTVVDVFIREALCIRVGQRLRGEDVVEACNQLVAQRGAPVRVLVDNGSEFSGRLMDLWAYRSITWPRLDYLRLLIANSCRMEALRILPIEIRRSNAHGQLVYDTNALGEAHKLCN